MKINALNLGLAAGISSLLFQALQLITIKLIVMMQPQHAVMVPPGMGVMSTLFTSALYFAFGAVLATIYNRLTER